MDVNEAWALVQSGLSSRNAILFAKTWRADDIAAPGWSGFAGRVLCAAAQKTEKGVVAQSYESCHGTPCHRGLHHDYRRVA